MRVGLFIAFFLAVISVGVLSVRGSAIADDCNGFRCAEEELDEGDLEDAIDDDGDSETNDIAVQQTPIDDLTETVDGLTETVDDLTETADDLTPTDDIDDLTETADDLTPTDDIDELTDDVTDDVAVDTVFEVTIPSQTGILQSDGSGQALPPAAPVEIGVQPTTQVAGVTQQVSPSAAVSPSTAQPSALPSTGYGPDKSNSGFAPAAYLSAAFLGLAGMLAAIARRRQI